jgi:hypothetical protein
MSARSFPRRLRSALVLFVCVVAVASLGGKGDSNPGVMPTSSNAFGRSCGEWAARWWQWDLSIPEDVNPCTDETGEDALRGQSGHVWFLCGISGAEGTATRTVTVPAGTALFFPIFTYAWVNTPEFGDPEWSPEQEAAVRELAAEIVEGAESVTAEVDGRPVADLRAYRCQNDEPFMVDMPDGNLFGVPAGTYGPSVTDGYFLMLAPLSRGRHTIHFRSVADGKVQDVTYHLTVAPGKK